MIKKHIAFSFIIITAMLTMLGCSNNNVKNTNSEILSTTPSTQSEEVQTQNNIIKENESTAIENNTTSTDAVESSDEKEASSESKSKNMNTTEIKNSSSQSTKKKIIVIDAGHGGKSISAKEPVSPGSNVMKAKNVSGASGVATGTPEHVINLKVALKLKEYLSKSGYNVIMTRTSNAQTISNVERAEVGNKNNADLVIRIHADSSTNSSIIGASMLVPGEVGYAKDIYKKSRTYGDIVLSTLVDTVHMKNKGVVTRTDLTGFNWSKVPVILIEMGFLSNHQEDKLLSSESYQEKIALGLFKGVEKALID